jgi:hypothetical protein
MTAWPRCPVGEAEPGPQQRKRSGRPPGVPCLNAARRPSLCGRLRASRQELLTHVAADILTDLAGDINAAVTEAGAPGEADVAVRQLAAACREFRRWSLRHRAACRRSIITRQAKTRASRSAGRRTTSCQARLRPRLTLCNGRLQPLRRALTADMHERWHRNDHDPAIQIRMICSPSTPLSSRGSEMAPGA